MFVAYNKVPNQLNNLVMEKNYYSSFINNTKIIQGICGIPLKNPRQLRYYHAITISPKIQTTSRTL